MLTTITNLTPADPDLPPRSQRLALLKRVLDGTLYDVLPFEFHDERTAAGDYIPLRKRRPSVRYPLARIVVDDSLSLVFSDGHYPTIASPHADTRAALADITAECGLNQVMADAAMRGSIGSVAIQLRVLRSRVFCRVLDTQYLTPVFDPMEPDTLLSVTERYKVAGVDLAGQGYELPDPAMTYWFQRIWDAEAETWFLPTPVYPDGAPDEPLADEVRTVTHALGFVPIVWIRNLPGGDDIDGDCTFRAAIDTSIEIDYQLSQAGRGLKYSSDPLLLIREPAAGDGEIAFAAAETRSSSARREMPSCWRSAGPRPLPSSNTCAPCGRFALEGVHGNRASADRIAAAQSGRALELMNQGLIWLADNLRVSYGRGLLQLAQHDRARQRRSTRSRPMAPRIPARSNRPPASPLYGRAGMRPRPTDRAADAQTLVTLDGSSGLLPTDMLRQAGFTAGPVRHRLGLRPTADGPASSGSCELPFTDRKRPF